MIESRVVRGGAAFPDENVIETLTIDDHTVSVKSPWTLEGHHVTEARDTVSRSSAARSRFGATEAESKAVRDASEATLTGAQILGNEGYVGAPDTRRLALQVRSFQLAKLPVISTLAAEMFTGSWTAVAMYRRPILVVFRHMYEFNSLEPKAVYRFGAKAREELILAACLAPLAVTDLRAQVPQKLWALDASPARALTSARLSLCPLAGRSGDMARDEESTASLKLDRDVCSSSMVGSRPSRSSTRFRITARPPPGRRRSVRLLFFMMC